MSHDIVIRNGMVVDGSGAEPVRADVAIDGDRITAVGDVPDAGTREIDATGRLVTPGFVDIHTHLDAQLSWDPIGTSSCWHGITSVVLGNCGVTFAPCRPDDRRYLAEMMESVEDIPADAIMSGLDWSWTSYGEYLDAIDRMPKGVNAGGMVGHCAVRTYAMRERSLDREPASDEDIAAMCELVDEAIAAGALGFSTSRTPLHRVPDGRNVPGTFADAREILAIAEVLGRHGRGIFESAPAFIGDATQNQSEVDLMAEVCFTTGRPVTFGLTQTSMSPTLHTDVLAAVEKAVAEGANLRPQTTARGVGVVFGATHRTPFDRTPEWKALRKLDLDTKLATFRDPEQRARLVAAVEAVPSPIPMTSLFVMPDGDASYDNVPEQSLAAVAARMGTTPADAFMTLSVERDGRLLVNFPFLNDDLAEVEGMLQNPLTVMGLADAGAHVGQIMDSSQPTYFLTRCVRDRDMFSVGEGIRKLTSEPAELFGIADRGVLRVGAFADVNVIDLEGMRLPQPVYVHDFPGGAGRFVQKATGYDHTIVNGQPFMEHGEHTGALAGRLLRSAPASA
jgi:N-acyl-D-aspartate/D-glutamate deacylase